MSKRSGSSTGVKPKKANDNYCDDPEPPKDLGEIIKAPLDTKAYKAIELPNGLKVMLVSTCEHKLEECHKSKSMDECKFKLIRKFNKDFIGLNTVNSSCFNICGSSEDHLESKCSSECSLKAAQSNKIEKCCEGQAAVSLCVGVGSFHDPEDLQGLAHLTEHCLFLGSEKSRPLGNIMDVTNKYNGYGNAETDYEKTTIRVRCDTEGFELLLRILVEAITKPLLEDSSITSEVEAVDAEYAAQHISDAVRSFDFMGYIAKKDHPLNKFAWGNKKTLGKNKLPKEMRNWMNKYYGANFMTLCLQGPYSIEELSRLAQKHFSSIPVKDTPSPKETILATFGKPFDPKDFNKCYHLVPVEDSRSMLITWSLPLKFWEDYESKPLLYLKVVLNSPAEGGIFRYLRDKHWITHFEASSPIEDANYFRNSFCSLYGFELNLTKEGFENRGEIMRAISGYIKLLIKKGPQENILEEMRTTQANYFHFNNWEDLLESSVRIAHKLQSLKKEDTKYVLTSRTLITKYDKDKVNQALKLLELENANIVVMAKEFANEPNQIVSENGRFVYTVGSIPSEFTDNIQIDPYFKLPPGSNFLRKNMEFPPHQDNFLAREDEAVLYQDQNLKMIYFKINPDICYTDRLPWASFELDFLSPEFDMSNQPMMYLWIDFLNIFINRKMDKPYDKLYTYQWTVENESLRLAVEGPSFQLIELFCIITDVFNHFSDYLNDAQAFENHKIEHIDKLNAELSENDMLASDLMDYLLLQNHLTRFHFIHSLKDLNHKIFLHFIHRYKSKMFLEMNIRGSVTILDVETIKKNLQKIIYRPFNHRIKIMDRAIDLRKGCSILKIRAKHLKERTSIVSNFYQFGRLDERPFREMHDLFVKILKGSSYKQLRTLEQLGYAINCENWNEANCYGVILTVRNQPEKYTVERVDERIDAFLVDFYQEHFNNEKDFKRMIAKFTKDNVSFKLAKDIFGKFFLSTQGNEDTFRKFSIQIVGYQKHETKHSVNKSGHLKKRRILELIYDYPTPNTNSKYIKDITSFKNKLGLQPNADYNN